ncbi:MAG TPA: hypothetical protein VMD05_05100, partial [Candidatus Nanoarchaeia archaeon]|nr:hypothetical protein [Candidatus Nanoarchaeia archaeon]
MVASLFVVYMVGQYARYFSTNKVVAPIQVSGNFGIDIMGALIPVTIGIFSTIIFVCLKISWKKYIGFFFFSLLLNYVTGEIAPGGFLIKPLENVIIINLVVVSFILGKNPLTETRKKIVSSTVIVLSVIPLTLFLSDLLSAPLFAKPTIGGAGLADGIIVSTLYAPFVTGIISSFYVFLWEINSILSFLYLPCSPTPTTTSTHIRSPPAARA